MKTHLYCPFKAGDEIEIIDCPALRAWSGHRKAIGRKCVLTHEDIKHLKISGSFYPWDNHYCINFNINMIRKTNGWDT